VAKPALRSAQAFHLRQAVTEAGEGTRARMIAREASAARWRRLAEELAKHVSVMDTEGRGNMTEAANANVEGQLTTVGVASPTFTTTHGLPTVPATKRPPTVLVNSVACRVEGTR
jgi:hypothetical protein